MLSLVWKSIRGGICNAIHRYGNADYKYMKDHEKKYEDYRILSIGM